MSKRKSLNAPFKAAKPEVRRYISELERENLRLHKLIAKLQAQTVTQEHRIVALEQEMKELTKKHGFRLSINMGDNKKQNESTEET